MGFTELIVVLFLVDIIPWSPKAILKKEQQNPGHHIWAAVNYNIRVLVLGLEKNTVVFYNGFGPVPQNVTCH